jgi:acetolactate synthase-1/2/3 large subunit
MLRRGGKLLVDQLVVHGTDTVFCVPGESYLAALDGLVDTSVCVITCRHEAGAANMADAYGKLTGRPGVCFVTRGPGATHAAVGIHTAYQDSTPLILFVGQVASGHLDREAFQEIDYRQMFGSLTKWAAQIDSVDRIPEYIARAFATACAGRPGPVVLALPEDMLRAESNAADARPFHVVQPHPGSQHLAQLSALLERSERPLAVLGGAGWTENASAGLREFLESNRLPAVAAFRRQDVLDNDSPSYVGDLGLGPDPRLLERVRAADLLLVVGARLGEMTTRGYTLLSTPTPQQVLVHVHPSAEELGRVYQPELPILSGAEQFADAVAGLRVTGGWSDWTAAARAEWESWHSPNGSGHAIDLAECIAHLHERLPDAIVTNGAGNYTIWVHRFWRYHTYPSELAPTSGAMGYGIPAAIAAKAVHPERPVVCIAGDGDFLMSAQELATAAHHSLPILVLVVNNNMYGTIRMHQERSYPGRTIGTDLTNPDFATFARAFGAHAETISKTAEFPAAVERALESGGLALIELQTAAEAITPHATLTELRLAASTR